MAINNTRKCKGDVKMKSNDTQCGPKITDFIGDAESEMPRGVRERENETD